MFTISIGDKHLLYAPLHKLTALVNNSALTLLRDHLRFETPLAPTLRPMAEWLRTVVSPPMPRSGRVCSPIFLGLIPTRGCNMACPYCDFAAPKRGSARMDLETARRAVDAYFQLLDPTSPAEIHFFGGEPFFAEDVVHFVVEYASMRAAERGVAVRFEATSNGLYSQRQAHWVGQHFDTIVLSLDGPPDIQDRYRPGANGRPVSDVVMRTASILSQGSVELVIRVCVTSETVMRLAEIASWISHEFLPSTVCFETLSLSHNAQPISLVPPDPWDFARNFDLAARVLADNGIQAITSTANLRAPRLSFCPVGQDALIVSPDGAVDACYLLQKDWERRGLDMRVGWLNAHGFDLLPESIQRVRNLTVEQRRLCADCLCRYSCAGGCHVNHDTSGEPGQYDSLCIQTRLITVARLLRRIGQHELADLWLSDRQMSEAALWQPGDRFVPEEAMSL